jgi:hypothetical protein
MSRPGSPPCDHQISAELPHLAEGSSELRNAHIYLQNIRRALARPQPGFTPR